MTDAIINVSRRYELSLSTSSGNFATGLTITYEVRDSLTNTLLDSGTMSETSGVYHFDYTATTLGQIRIKYFTPTAYPDAIETVDVITAPANADDVTNIIAEIDANEAKIDTIDSNVDAILVDTNEIQTKLPNNNIMGSSVKTDKDDEIDAIKAKTDNLPVDPASETNATANKDEVIGEIDDNEAKIDALPTAAQIADQVWDEPLADHLGAGSTGEALDNADAVADPEATAEAVWEFATRELTGIGGSGIASEANATTNKDEIITEVDANETKLDSILTFLSTLISGIWANVTRTLTGIGSSGIASEANATTNTTSIINEVNANEVKIDGIKAKTDNLPVDPASETNATANKDEVIGEIDVNETKIDNLSTQLTNAEANIIAEIDANEVKIDGIDTDLSAIATKITYILGLSEHNKQIKDMVYDGDDNLVSCTMRLYANANDAENDNNHIKEYFVTSQYDVEGKVTKYVVTE